MPAAHSRTSSSGWARIRSSSDSNAWPAAVETHVRLGRGWQQATERIERLGANGRPVHRFRVGRTTRVARLEVGLHARDPFRVACERRVHRPHIAIVQRAAADLRRHVIPPAIVAAVGVGHVAGRLLEVRHQPSPLEHLGQDVRHGLARDVRAAQLRDRVVAVVAEHPGVEALGTLDRGAGGRRGLRRLGVRPDLVRELVEEQPPQRLARPGIAGEQRPLHRFRQVRQREDVAVEIGEVGRQPGALVRGERLGGAGGAAGPRSFVLHRGRRRVPTSSGRTPRGRSESRAPSCDRRTAPRSDDRSRAESPAR